jgi:hypothetical protein
MHVRKMEKDERYESLSDLFFKKSSLSTKEMINNRVKKNKK